MLNGRAHLRSPGMLPPLTPTSLREDFKVRRTLALLVAIALVVAAFFAASAAAYPVAHATKKSAAEVTRYWTAERMRQAIPADRDSRPVPSAKPARGGGGGGTSPGKSIEVSGDYPSAIGKVFFTSASGVNYVCSGSAVGTASKSVVWTAGHCVNEGPGGFYDNFNFVPAYRNGATPYGEFAATTLHTTSGWLASGEFGVDVGAAVVGTNGAGKTLSEAVDEVSLVFDVDDLSRVQNYKIYGYPAAKKFNGQLMRVCETSWLLDDTSANPATMGAACDMTGGSSGGPWITGGGAVASVTSYGYYSLKNVLFGPHLEDEAQTLYNTAIATP
jgi:V8-like Glu-specific endopeptidase